MCGFSMKSDDKMEKPAVPMLAPEALPKSKASMETQSANGGGGRRKGWKRNRKICICCVTLLIVVLFICILLLVLGLTLFKPKRPITTVDSIVVDRLRASLDALNLKVILNLTLIARVSLKNPNRVGFSFGSSSALLNYGGQIIGEAPLPASQIGPQKTLPMNLTLTLMVDRILSESQLFSDVMSDSIPVNTFVKVAGKVSLLKIFNFKYESSSSCDIVISVSNRNVTSQLCRYSTKL